MSSEPNKKKNESGQQLNRRKFLKSIPFAIGLPYAISRSVKAEDMHVNDSERTDNPNAKKLLTTVPDPVIPSRPDLIKMYHKCWELGNQNSVHGTPQNGFVDWYIDASFDNRIFQWDTCFCIAWAKYSQGALPNIQSMDNFYRKQHPDGAISGVIRKKDGTDDQPESSPWFTRNNLFSWIEYEYYLTTGDSSRFNRVVPILVKYAHWIQKNRRHPNGHYFWSGWSSGMDNSPRSRADKFYPPYSWVDYDANEALAAYYLVEMAKVIGDTKTVIEFSQLHDQIKKLVNRDMWSKKDHFYWDLDKDNSFVKVMTVASFWTLWGRIANDHQVQGLVDHLNDTNTFNRPHRVPTLSASENKYAPSGKYWRGSVWAPTNHMIVKGLMANGHYKLARDIVLNHLNNVAAIFSGTNTVWENYAPEFDKPGAPAQDNFVGWSGVGPIAQLIENYIGINLNVPKNEINWYLLSTESLGIKNLNFGKGKISLIAHARKHIENPVKITVDAPQAFTLNVNDGKKVYKKSVQKGKSEITITP